MLVEDEVRGRALERPERRRGEEEIVRRIPRMNRGDGRAAACSSQGEQRPHHRLALLADLAADAGSALGLREELEVNAGVRDLAQTGWRQTAADERDLVPGCCERLRLPPRPKVHLERGVLAHDDDVWRPHGLTPLR